MVNNVKYMKMDNYYRREGEPLEGFQITEKLDGANFRWEFPEPGTIVFGSRNNMGILKVSYDTEGYEIVDNNGATLGKGGRGGTFERFARFVAERVVKATHNDPMAMDVIPEYLVFYGEAVGNHKIQYEPRIDAMVMGFAVFDTIQGIYRSDWAEWMTLIKVPIVPILNDVEPYKGLNPDQLWNEVINNEEVSSTLKSQYDGVSRIEGIVLADYNNQTFFKLKTKEFLERTIDKKIVTETYETIEDMLMETFCTDARIDKILFKLENEELGYNKKNPFVSVVGHLSKDIVVESLDAVEKELRRHISQRLPEVLREPKYIKRIMGLMEK